MENIYFFFSFIRIIKVWHYTLATTLTVVTTTTTASVTTTVSVTSVTATATVSVVTTTVLSGTTIAAAVINPDTTSNYCDPALCGGATHIACGDTGVCILISMFFFNYLQ